MLGERSGKLYRLGDRVAVQVASVNLDERKIGFCFPKTDKTTTEGAIPTNTPANPKKRRTNTKTRAPRREEGGHHARYDATKDNIETIRALMMEDETPAEAADAKTVVKKKRRRNNNNRRRREPAA
jgi:ribonuclease R